MTWSTVRSHGVWSWPFEVVLVAVLTVSWTVGFLAARASLADVAPGTRNFFLALYETDDRLVIAAVLGLVGVAILVARHWYPTASFVGVSVVVFLIEWRYPFVIRVQFATTIMLLVAVFWALWRTDRFRPLALVAVAVGALVTVPAYRVNTNLSSASTIEATPERLVDLTSLVGTLESVILVAVAIGAAALVRRFDAQAAELAVRNRELTEQRAATARAAVLDERVRISRELHDVVAHHVTTMTVHAGAARQIVAADPEAATGSLHQIEQAGRTAVLELQRLLGFLRDGDDDPPDGHDRAPVPSLRHLDALGSSLGVGIDCEVTVSGDLGAIPQSVDVSAYRIVQEALTNVMKHSTAGRAEVSVVADDRQVEVRVADRGPARRPPARNGTDSGPANGHGHGLVGMRERATLHGGTVAAGPDGAGWLVRARLPYEVVGQ
ncbi:MAG: histidine kinase [Actinomycetota bacterium]